MVPIVHDGGSSTLKLLIMHSSHLLEHQYLVPLVLIHLKRFFGIGASICGVARKYLVEHVRLLVDHSFLKKLLNRVVLI